MTELEPGYSTLTAPSPNTLSLQPKHAENLLKPAIALPLPGLQRDYAVQYLSLEAEIVIAEWRILTDRQDRDETGGQCERGHTGEVMLTII